MKEDPDLEARGKAQRAEGAVDAEAERELNYAKGVADTAVGRVKDAVGHGIGRPGLSDKGAAQALKGDVERGLNKK